ncbi:hypothetical protein G7Z12_18375 [Streptomyces sp. ID38640]|uniref:hypothetical protein n=1 Tax=Streptomyces sp. ID38640 TaxID=1265399 RepID=UPI00140F4493|nr:hypothetical protein [Streptomyces sp. ID38640]QIK07709.1 hypothetical protein G7Z12_18375 [Streptomyces sp. ID38640]
MVTGRTTYRGIAVLAALAAVPILPGAVGVASADAVPHYRTADGATKTEGSSSAAHAPQLKPGLHTDAIKRGEQKWYAVNLDARTSAYFSAVAAPPPGTKVEDYGDKLTLTVQDSNGTTCGSESRPSFNGGGMAYPIADYATRRIGADRTECQKAGPYYLVITREGSATSGPDTWPLELNYLNEPPLEGNTPAKPGKGLWSTATPAPRTDTTKRSAKGGTGFNDAGSVATGVWKDRIRPGETRFYRVPVDWGQRLNLSAELPNATSAKATGFLPRVLGLSVYNPARGVVGNPSFVSYTGKPAAAKEFTAPVDYGNRFDTSGSVNAMRFAGWYYLEVSLHPDAAQYFPKAAELTLRVDVRGTAKAGPGYAEPTRVFSVTPEDRETAEKGQSAQEASKNGTLMTVAYAGIGTGVVLLVGLGAWTLAARRSAAGAAGTPAGPGTAGGPGGRPSLPEQSTDSTQQAVQNRQFGPPQGW